MVGKRKTIAFETVLIRPVDQGRINGELEIHFCGSIAGCAKPPKVMRDVTPKLLAEWNKQRKKIGDNELKLRWEFEKLFRVKLPRGRRITHDLCDAWDEKFEILLGEIEQMRAGHLPGPRKEDQK